MIFNQQSIVCVCSTSFLHTLPDNQSNIEIKKNILIIIRNRKARKLMKLWSLILLYDKLIKLAIINFILIISLSVDVNIFCTVCLNNSDDHTEANTVVHHSCPKQLLCVFLWLHFLLRTCHWYPRSVRNREVWWLYVCVMKFSTPLSVCEPVMNTAHI